MAIRYLWSGATGAADGSSWADAFTTWADAYSGMSFQHDVVYVGHDHYEIITATSSTAYLEAYTSNSSYRMRAIAVNRTTGQKVTTPQVNFQVDDFKYLTIRGHYEYEGLGFAGGLSRSLTVQPYSKNSYLKNCLFDLSASSNYLVYSGRAGSLIDCIWDWGSNESRRDARLFYASSGAGGFVINPTVICTPSPINRLTQTIGATMPVTVTIIGGDFSGIQVLQGGSTSSGLSESTVIKFIGSKFHGPRPSSIVFDGGNSNSSDNYYHINCEWVGSGKTNHFGNVVGNWLGSPINRGGETVDGLEARHTTASGVWVNDFRPLHSPKMILKVPAGTSTLRVHLLASQSQPIYMHDLWFEGFATDGTYFGRPHDMIDAYEGSGDVVTPVVNDWSGYDASWTDATAYVYEQQITVTEDAEIEVKLHIVGGATTSWLIDPRIEVV